MKRLLAALCILALVFALPFAAQAEQPAFLSAEEWAVLSLVNGERAEEGRAPISVFGPLQSAADLRATEIADFFSHTRPNGENCFTALELYDVDYFFAGENIAAGHRSPAEVVEGWMNSTGHRENILNTDFRHMACGYYVKEGSVYYTHWAQFFVGGCQTTGLAVAGGMAQFDRTGRLIGDPMLEVSCSLHGKSYLRLADLKPTCSSTAYGTATFTVTYDGFTEELPCFVGYSDVNRNAWYAPAVEFVCEEGLMNGISPATFAPDMAMTRAQVVMTLYRLSGEPLVAGESAFSDVRAGQWHYDAVRWAAENGVVGGIGNGLFAPDAPVTRAQLVTILYRYTQLSGGDTAARAELSGFADGNALPAWAEEAIRWSVAEGIISGMPVDGQNAVNCDGKATRAQIATILMRYLEN